MKGIFGIYSPDGLTYDYDALKELFYKHHFVITKSMDHRHSIFFSLTTATVESHQRSIHSEKDGIICSGDLIDSSISLEEKVKEILGTGMLDDFQRLEGTFAVVRIDEKTHQPQVINDRDGHMRIFYSLIDGTLFISSRFLLLLEFLKTKTIHPQGLASYLLFGYPLEQDTLVKEITLLSPGSILAYDKKTISIHQYYNYFYHGDIDQRPQQELLETLSNLWKKAMEKRVNTDDKNLILLSGGLDSRTILAETIFLLPKHNIITATYGEKEGYDYTIAKKITNNYGLQHYYLERDFKDFDAQYRLSLELVDGMIDATPYYPMTQYKRLKDHGSYVISGLFGGELMGPLIFSKIKKNYEKNVNEQKSRSDILLNHHILNNIDIIKSILHPNFMEKHNPLTSFHQSVSGIDEISNETFYQYCAAWMYRNETYKYTVYCNFRFPHLFNYQTPFYDHDLMDFMFKIPPKYRVDKTLYKNMISTRYPELFSIPTKNSYGLSLFTSPFRLFLRRIKLGGLTRANKVFTRLVKRNLFIDPLENYIDYNDLIRTNKEYKSFISHHLDQLKQYEFFDAKGIDTIWKDHLNGKAQHAPLIGLLVTFDLFMETYINPDQENK